MTRSRISETLAADLREEMRALSFEERFELSLELGDQAVALRAAALGVDEERAREELRRRAQLGRRPCRCLAPD